MAFNKAADIPHEKKITAVETYLHTNQSLRKIALEMGVSHPTLWHWVKLYENRGKHGLKHQRLQTRRRSKDIETEVMFLKERNPGLSIRKATQLMRKKGVQISNFGIWQVWKAYGLGKRNVENPLDVFIEPTPELEYAMSTAQQFVKKKDYKNAAKILNSFPCIPRCQFLMHIPEKFLITRRRLDRLSLENREVSFEQFAKKARRIGAILEKEGYIYSSILANFLELDALDIIGKPEKKVGVLRNLSRKMRGVKHYSLRFLFCFEQVYTSIYLLQITRALRFIKKCRRFVYLLPYPFYWELFGGLLISVGKFKNAGRFYKMAFEREKKPDIVGRLALQIARYAYCYAGEYSKCRKMLANVQVNKDGILLGSSYSLTNAYMCFGEGNFADAAQYFIESLEKAEKGKHCNRIYATSVGLAGLAMALNKREEAKSHLKKYLSLMRKNRLMREELLLKFFINPETKISHELMQTSPFCLLNLLQKAKQTLKAGDYRKAFNFAKKHGLLGLFHRWVVFFSEPVLRLLEAGKTTDLPRTILNFPLFNQNVPVYHVKFLGNVIISRNHKHLSAKLTPKEKAFFIHLALRAGEPGKFIRSSELFRNFWSRSKNPTSLLMHLLVSIRKKIKLPGHLLAVVSYTGESRLVNRGFYLTTDYDEFKTLLVQIKPLEQAGELEYARQEYVRAFKLIRTEPFKKMYDNWSENQRRVILNQIETNAVNFIEGCITHEDKKTARKILEKVSKLIPNSEEIKKLLEKAAI